jgi:hypothetical protein
LLPLTVGVAGSLAAVIAASRGPDAAQSALERNGLGGGGGLG